MERIQTRMKKKKKKDREEEEEEEKTITQLNDNKQLKPFLQRRIPFLFLWKLLLILNKVGLMQESPCDKITT